MPPLHVVIVGGGVSGCAAADRLAALLPASALAITLLEAAPRLGGRTLSVPLASAPGTTMDLGGQWIGTHQSAALQVVRDLGLALHAQHHAGKRVLHLQGQPVRTYTGLIPNASWAVLLDAQATLAVLALLRLLLWLAPGSTLARWADAVSVAALSARVTWTAGARALVRIVVQGLFGAEPEDVSLNSFCRYVTASGGVEPMTEVGPGTLQCWTVVGGTQQLSAGLLARAGAARVATRTGHRVLSIRHRAPGSGGGAPPVTLTCDTGAEFACDYVILALPPPLAARIAFSPALDSARAALMAGARMGGIIKSIAVYESAFWREEGFSGEAIAETSESSAAPVFNTFDNCLPPREGAATATPASGPNAGIALCADSGGSGSGGRRVPALVLFINGARAVEWSARPAEERKEVVLQQLARWFGPRALYPVEYLEKDWVSDAFTAGCPIASYPAALLTEYGLQRALAEPCWPAEACSSACRLHWAGTECALEGTGFIDGAIRAGQAAGEGVARAISSQRAAAAGGGGEAGGSGGGAALLHPPPGAAAAAAAQQQQQRQLAQGLAGSKREQLDSLL
jgi:monoamine oxidase